MNNIMTFQYISDVHFDTQNSKLVSVSDIIEPVAPMLLIAGDLGRVENYKEYVSVLKELCSMFQHVILVPGNHEYYTSDPNTSYSETKIKLLNLPVKIPNLHVLDDTYVIIGEILLYGSTFWSYCPHQYFKGIPIYNDEKNPVSAYMYNNWHLTSKLSLENIVNYSRSMQYKMIVVTHHAPTFYEVLDAKYRDSTDTKNYMYCSQSDLLLENDVIKYWVYGHTGHNRTPSLDGNKLISNQYLKNGWNKKAVFQL